MNEAGAAAERRVRRHFVLRGYRILASNARAGGRELDIVARRGRRIVFCEVKMRRSVAFGAPAEAVGYEKARRVARGAEAWLGRHPELADLEVSLEVAAVRGRRIERMPLVLES